MMTDFNEIKKICDAASSLSQTVIDDFILHYAASKDNLSREFDQKIASYRHITQPAHASWVRLLKSQYIVHNIFKSNGLLRKYLNHAAIKHRSVSDQVYLKEQLATPWRFCFSKIIGCPANDFYQMEDVFSGESFLLYSKNTTQTLMEQSPILWFNLIAFNGACWQTFGPLNAYQSFDPDDIFFFSTELNPQVDSDEALMQDVEKNPIPYMLLLDGARIPITMNKNDELLMLFSEHEREMVDASELKNHFKIEYNDGVFRISLKEWEEPPHFAAAYFDEEKKLLVVTSMTERAFSGLIKMMNKHGLDFPTEPQVRIHLSMFFTAEKILKKKIPLNPYESRFVPKSTPQASAEIEKLNIFLRSVLPAINAGQKPDIKLLAKKAGIDESLAEKLVTDSVRRMNILKKG